MPSWRQSVRSDTGGAPALVLAGRIVGSTSPVATGTDLPAEARAVAHDVDSYTLQVPARVSRRSTAIPAGTASPSAGTVVVVVDDGAVVALVVEVVDVEVVDDGSAKDVGDDAGRVVGGVAGAVMAVVDDVVVGKDVVVGVVDDVVVDDVVTVGAVADVVVVGGIDPAPVTVNAEGDVTTGS